MSSRRTSLRGPALGPEKVRREGLFFFPTRRWEAKVLAIKARVVSKHTCARARVAHGWRWLAVLALLGSALSSYAGDSKMSLDPAVPASAPHGAEQRIVALVRDWFAALEVEPLESPALDGFLAEPFFELLLIGASVRSLGEFEAWRSHLSATHRQRVYRIDSIHVEPAGENTYRARFEFERRAVDDGGFPHIAHREHTWLVRDVPGEAPVILRIDERPLLAFPGTGPQIVCY
jgi:hypothetical protein